MEPSSIRGPVAKPATLDLRTKHYLARLALSCNLPEFVLLLQHLTDIFRTQESIIIAPNDRKPDTMPAQPDVEMQYQSPAATMCQEQPSNDSPAEQQVR
ncbi:uncharacterized protein MYCFIDRAFT_173720 [Pseudocercospora fijiensis CIRAD86]|uniref:Uncharacterized protein n=1 Tax=Pseudocercospora fijiensis (strain CIRAD86) TaxID=383855 RepID=M2Z4S6_PSEFD|nr:uncharacterized protein MYCFIDRAFT_173720 [Pseudocercospora fijiensis CIRAD86]EME84795.1 hypothetical protein MYCFIDRAFT_173720 [Pseudocercospora fijiensis CIRAD86]